MWKARNKTELIIEIWEKLDCENIGAAEIEAIETVVADQYGDAAVDSPMVIARLLADEGAQLRHAEIMNLFLERASVRPYDAVLRNILKLEDLRSAAASIRQLENLRQKYARENDKKGLRLIRETALCGKRIKAEKAEKKDIDPAVRQVNAEIAEWFTVWLQTPELFESWLRLRQSSPEFAGKFSGL